MTLQEQIDALEEIIERQMESIAIQQEIERRLKALAFSREQPEIILS